MKVEGGLFGKRKVSSRNIEKKQGNGGEKVSMVKVHYISIRRYKN
jgi:hypothetical protein